MGERLYTDIFAKLRFVPFVKFAFSSHSFPIPRYSSILSSYRSRTSGMLSRALRRSAGRLASAICRPSSSSSTARPDLDFDYLLDEQNGEEIRKNIASRKQMGDLDTILRLWKQIEPALMDKERKAAMEEGEWQRLWDELYLQAASIPNRSHPSAPVGDESLARVVKMIGEPPEELPNAKTAEEILTKFKMLQRTTTRTTCGERSYALLGRCSSLL